MIVLPLPVARLRARPYQEDCGSLWLETLGRLSFLVNSVAILAVRPRRKIIGSMWMTTLAKVQEESKDKHPILTRIGC